MHSLHDLFLRYTNLSGHFNQSYDGFIQGVVDPRVTEASIFGVSFVCIPALGPVQPVHFVILDTPVA